MVSLLCVLLCIVYCTYLCLQQIKTFDFESSCVCKSLLTHFISSLVFTAWYEPIICIDLQWTGRNQGAKMLPLLDRNKFLQIPTFLVDFKAQCPLTINLKFHELIAIENNFLVHSFVLLLYTFSPLHTLCLWNSADIILHPFCIQINPIWFILCG